MADRTWSVLALTSALMLGCGAVPPKMGPDYQTPSVDLPQSWRNQSPAQTLTPELAQWWRGWQDPLLNQLMAQALTQNLDLRQAQAKLRQVRASRVQAESSLYPSVSASLGTSRNQTAGVISPVPARTVFDAGFDASWELDIFGANRRGAEAALADQDASAASLAQTQVSLLAEVARNYIELRSAQRRLAIAQDNLQAQTETLDITRWRYQAGLAPLSDVEQAQTNQAQTRASLPDLDISAHNAQNRLAVLLGQVPGQLSAQLAHITPWPQVPEQLASGIPAQVLTRRPDIVVVERNLAAATARVGQAQAQRFPSLKLGASFGWQAYSLNALGSAGTLTKALTSQLAATLFDAGKLRSAVEIKEAAQEQALLSYQSTVLTALEEVENALKAYALAHERLAARELAANSARNAAQLARQQYQAGLADFQKVLDSERSRLSSEDSLVTAQASQRTSLIALYKALGGGWQSQP